jgi:Mce-associated membrane protein
MPPSRRRQPQQPQQQGRRPRVAGLRRPDGQTAPVEVEQRPAEQTDILPKITDAPPAETPAPEPEPQRPRPSGRRRPSPTPRPGPVETTAEQPAVEVQEPVEVIESEPEDTGRSRSGLLVPVVLGVVAVLLGGLAAWFGVQWASAGSGGTNTALTDSATTSEVSGQVTSAVNTIFSYNYADMAKTQKAVQQLLTGSALCQYNELYKVVQQQAPSQKLVLTTTVQNKGVEMLQGSTARVLLLVQQHDTRATTSQQSDSQSMIAVNAVKQGAQWKISAIDTFNGSNPTTCKS